MFSRKISFGVSWSLIGCAAIFCFYMTQLLLIVANDTSSSEAFAYDFDNRTTLVETVNITNSNPINHMITLKTNYGDITLELYPDKAPNTVANFEKLAKAGFYDGIKFHRVIKGFMIQAGDPLSKDDSQKNRWGQGGPGYQFADELKGNEKYPQGTLAMANAGPNTNGSQFFIVTASPEAPLPPSYTVFGKVVSGLDVALKIENIPTFMPGTVDRPLDNVMIKEVTIK